MKERRNGLLQVESRLVLLQGIWRKSVLRQVSEAATAAAALAQDGFFAHEGDLARGPGTTSD